MECCPIQDLEYAKTLGRAGVECELHLIPGVPHAFQDFAPESKAGRAVLESRYKVIEGI